MADFNDANRDPLTNEPGSHPVGTGVGAALGGAAAGAAAGAFGGPVGAAVGGVAGAVAGGLAGKAAGEAVNPTNEDAYWRENYHREPYYVGGRTYEQYRPAYELGWSSVDRYEGDYDAIEPRLADDWRARHGDTGLAWTDVRPATRAGYERAYNARPLDVLDNDDVIDTLNDLLESARDGEYGFHASAEHADSGQLKGIFQRHSRECAAAAAELEREIRARGGEPVSGGTVAGALHRGWVSVKTALSTQDDKAVLEECERGEDAAVARYRKALKATLPMDLRALVQRQADGAQRNHDEVKALRDSFIPAR